MGGAVVEESYFSVKRGSPQIKGGDDAIEIFS